MPTSQSKDNVLHIISHTLFRGGEHRAALALFKHMTDCRSSDMRSRMADCYVGLHEYSKALEVLESITEKSADVHLSLGNAYRIMDEYAKSEQSFLWALELYYSDIPSEKQYDYFDNLVKTDRQIEIRKITAPDDRLSKIISCSPEVIKCVMSLGTVYSGQRLFKLAEAYYNKTLTLISDLYGGGAAVKTTAITLRNLGVNYNQKGEHGKAERCFRQALDILRKISPGSEDSDTAYILNKLGGNCCDTGQNSEAEKCYKQALGIYRKVSQSSDSRGIAMTLRNLGYNYREAGDEMKAKAVLREALHMYNRVDPTNKSISRIQEDLDLGTGPESSNIVPHLSDVLSGSSPSDPPQTKYKKTES